MAEYKEVIDAGPGWTQVRNADGTISTVSGNRNWRNNNPGNLEYGDFTKSHGAIGTDGRFAVFPSYDAGRAAKENLIFESPNYRDLPLSGAISRYAPSFENNTGSYLDQVAQAAGVSPDTLMGQMTTAQRAAIMDAMQRVEGWRVGTIDGAPAPDTPRRLPAVPPAGGFDLGAPLPSQRRSMAGVQPGRRIMAPATPPSPHAFGFMDGAMGMANGALGAIGGAMKPVLGAARDMIPAAIDQSMSTVAGRSALVKYLTGQNIAKAPIMVSGFQPGGTQVVTSNGQQGTLMRAAGGQVGGEMSRSFDERAHPGQNMDIYRANAAAAGGGGNLNRSGIRDAIERGATMVRSR